MKAKLFDISGNQKADVELPSLFNTKIREDIAQKYFEVDKLQNMFLYSNFKEAGKRHSASGTISHQRHQWKGHYGRGISRIPRKTMWRRGTQFYWIGAEVSSTRGGRSVHAPSGIRTPKKMNKKETKLALASAFASTGSDALMQKRYSTITEIHAPFVIESLPKKTKDLISTLKKIFDKNISLILKTKKVRAGSGKSRGRKYKSNQGLLIVTGKSEDAKFSGVDVKQVKNVSISDLYPLGRLTLYTKKALEEMKDA